VRTRAGVAMDGSAAAGGEAASAPSAGAGMNESASSEASRPELPPGLAVRRIELGWVREQRRRSRQAEGAAVHIQRIYRGRIGRRRRSSPDGMVPADPAAGIAAQEDGGRPGGVPCGGAGGGAAKPAPMTAASYHRQKLRATKQRADGWRPPGPCLPIVLLASRAPLHVLCVHVH
jgi:hypothetical protein